VLGNAQLIVVDIRVRPGRLRYRPIAADRLPPPRIVSRQRTCCPA